MNIDLTPLIDALDRNTAALNAAAGAKGAANTSADKGAGAATKPAATGGKKGGSTAPKKTYDEMSAALMTIKDDFGLEEAKAVYVAHGYAKMADVKEADYAKIFDEATAKHAELTEAADDTGSGGDDL